MRSNATFPTNPSLLTTSSAGRSTYQSATATDGSRSPVWHWPSVA